MSQHSNFQPSPFQVQTPKFSTSPLDQIGGVHNSNQAGPSSRGALVQRAFTLTRNSSVKRSSGNNYDDQANNPYNDQSRRQQIHSFERPVRNNDDSYYNQIDTSDGRSGRGWEQEQYRSQQQAYGKPIEGSRRRIESNKKNESDQGFNGAAIQYGSGMEMKATPLHQNHPSTSIEKITINDGQSRNSKNSISDHVQQQRAARLSQQQFDIDQYRQNRESQMTIRSPPSNQEHDLSNAFRDSFASNISFNSITGSEERSSMMLLNNKHSPVVPVNDEEFANDTDRIAQEVRGLAMRRRPSLDTVRSSEFGEGGRWAKAWAGSDDGEDEEEEDEMDLQAMRTREMSNFDIEDSRNAQTGLGALGELGNLQGARAAMNGIESKRVLNSSQAHNVQIPQIQDVTNSLHTVNLTSSSSSSRKPGLRNSNEHQSQSLFQPSGSDLSRRDTILSVAGEIGQVANYSDITRSDSNASVSTIQDNNNNNNQHVKVWPPTPASSDVGSSTNYHTVRSGRSDTLRAIPATIGFGQSAKVESMEDSMKMPNKPISPSTLLSQTDQIREGDRNDAAYRAIPNNLPDGKPFAGYSDPNQYSFYAPPETFGKARRQAIADHDGRESMVSDLDVETLRLDGSSVAGGSQDEWDSRRGSTSTIGTVDSAFLSEQRRRRSRMEYQEARNNSTSTEREMDKRASTSTIRGGGGGAGYSQGLNESARYPSNIGSSALKRNVSHPSQPADPMGDNFNAISPPQPRRSNTLPDDQQFSSQNVPLPFKQQQQTNYTPNLAPAPWARNNNANQSPSSQQKTLSPSTRSTSIGTMNSSYHTSLATSASPASSKRSSGPNAIVQSEAEKFLTLGISHHESGDLSRSAFYFERSAKVEGGCVVGMCMWGMALREGWGIRKDQKRGFEWISRAASKAGDLMATNTNANGKARSESELKAIRSELKLSVYELGKCFCYGWGVKQDRQMALEYFELAAKLGDSDAQAEAGALLAAGKGCKKDLKKAAMYYRMAEAQGYDTVGLSWIHKDKYDPVTTTPVKSKR